MHVHASTLDALIVLAYLVILGAAWRTVSARFSEKPVGQAMAFIW